MFARSIASLAALSIAAAPHWHATLAPVEKSTVAGTAMVEALTPDSTLATLNVTGAKPNSELPWHIHNGGCSARGQILGDAKAYPAIKVDASGAGSSSVTLAIPAPASGEYSVEVHRSASDMTLAACGVLQAVKPDSLSVEPMPAPAPRDTTMRP